MAWIILLCALSFVVTPWVVWSVAFRMGERTGVAAALSQVRSDLDATLVEWKRRSDGGDLARSLELPGLTVVRRMFDA